MAEGRAGGGRGRSDSRTAELVCGNLRTCAEIDFQNNR